MKIEFSTIGFAGAGIIAALVIGYALFVKMIEMVVGVAL